jgi:uncharacterized membrane protein (DUF485 family)
MVRTDFRQANFLAELFTTERTLRTVSAESRQSVSRDRGGNVGASNSPSSAGNSGWSRIANSSDFRKLLASKKAFVVPATIFFVVYYFLLPVLVGYAPNFMQTKVIGPLNVAYLFALSQFAVVFIITYLYVRAARKFDAASARLISEFTTGGKEN